MTEPDAIETVWASVPLDGGPAPDPATRRCEDCDGRERMPCGAGGDACEFCGGTGRVPRGGAKAADGPAKPGGQ